MLARLATFRCQKPGCCSKPNTSRKYLAGVGANDPELIGMMAVVATIGVMAMVIDIVAVAVLYHGHDDEFRCQRRSGSRPQHPP